MLALERLPIAPASARAVIEAIGDDSDTDGRLGDLSASRRIDRLGLDPGWVVARARSHAPRSPLELVAEMPWWSISNAAARAWIERLWRNSVVISLMARRLAEEAGDRDPGEVARAGLLARLGLWAAAATEPEWLIGWSTFRVPQESRRFEIAELGRELSEMGRELAERWGLGPLEIDAAWLHGDSRPELRMMAQEPVRLGLVQQAVAFADRGPWSLACGVSGGPPASDPRGRIVEAEVKARCAGGLTVHDASPSEERVTRRLARIRLELARERSARMRAQILVKALAESQPEATPEAWADHTAFALCQQEGVHAVQVEWTGPSPPQPSAPANPGTPANPRRTPTLEVPLIVRGRPHAIVRLWCAGDAPLLLDWNESPTRQAWQNWASLVYSRDSAERRALALATALRTAGDDSESRLSREKLASLAEFAAGAGHELNNPLAVMIGRAQLLMASASDPAALRSLRQIVDQGNRLHRMLRDLMFIARPPEIHTGLCDPSTPLQRALDELAAEIKNRDLTLIAELQEGAHQLESDPLALEQLALLLLRNAIQATQSGGSITVRSRSTPEELVWSFEDSGHGFTREESLRLFDPFYCGRQAGRGLGLGLPRAAAIAQRLGARLDFTSQPGRGSTFSVSFPLSKSMAKSA